MSKIFVSAIFYLSFFYSLPGQTINSDKAIYQYAKDCNFRGGEEDKCKKGIQKADSMSKTKDYYLRIGYTTFSPTIIKTYHYLLQKKYGLTPYSTGCKILNTESCCFIKRSEDILDQRFGENFLKKIEQEADSLDAKKLGYLPPKYLGKERVLEKHLYAKLKKSFSKAEPKGELSFIVRFEIDSTGKVKQVKPDHVEEHEKQLLKKTVRLIKKKGLFKPAQFNSKDVSVWYRLQVDHFFLKEIYYYDFTEDE
ncbi:hypothetical protein RCC89_11040 [Cytophagaceae bacterium ABcell3]|nr:hypothetical protein RCC89_11040 [Cytophagaceae bacterium ABcell3]